MGIHGYFFRSIKSQTFYFSCTVVESDSKTALCVFENFCLITCFCFVSFAFFIVCFFNLMSPVSCLCDVITKSYLSVVIQQLWITIDCLFHFLSLDISVRMMVAKTGIYFCIS